MSTFSPELGTALNAWVDTAIPGDCAHLRSHVDHAVSLFSDVTKEHDIITTQHATEVAVLNLLLAETREPTAHFRPSTITWTKYAARTEPPYEPCQPGSTPQAMVADVRSPSMTLPPSMATRKTSIPSWTD